MAQQNGMQGGHAEKDFEHLREDHETEAALHKIRTAGSVSISNELFEKLYLQPRSGAAPAGELRKAVGNPTPIALIGFLLSLTPLSNDLMGWRGPDVANGSASIGIYFFFGGILMNVGALLEWVVGNTFPSVVFFSFGAFWLAWGATLQPFYSAQANYALANNLPASAGGKQAGFLNGFGFVLLWMGFMCTIYAVCALRTNIVFLIIFISLVGAFCCLAGAFWTLAQDQVAIGTNLVIAGGACAFVTTVAGWWIFAAILLASLDFPFSLPVGDLSHIIKGASEKSKV